LRRNSLVVACLSGLALISLSLSLSGCDNGCEQVRESFLRVSFVSTSGRTMKSINIICISGDRGYQASTTTFSDLELELNPEANQAVFTFECTYSDYGDNFTQKQNVIINYTSEPQFLDLSCGCTVMFDIQDAAIETPSNIDKPLFHNVIVNDSQIRNESGTNLTIEY